MVYKLPISKEDILSMTKDYLQRDDTTWVDGQVYFNKKDYSIQFHINEKEEIITMCIPNGEVYLEYDMNTSNLKSIIYTSTCWSDDWIKYDFDNNGNLTFIEERAYGHNRRAYINIENNVITNVEIKGSQFGSYEKGYIFEPDNDFDNIIQYFNEYFNKYFNIEINN